MSIDLSFGGKLSIPPVRVVHCGGYRCVVSYKDTFNLKLLRDLFPKLESLFDRHEAIYNDGYINEFSPPNEEVVLDGIGTVQVFLANCLVGSPDGEWLRDAQKSDSATCLGNAYFEVDSRRIPLMGTHALDADTVRNRIIVAILQHQLIKVKGDELDDEQRSSIENNSSIEELQESIRNKLDN